MSATEHAAGHERQLHEADRKWLAEQIAKAVTDEREACAKIAEGALNCANTPAYIAGQIRARGNQT